MERTENPLPHWPRGEVQKMKVGVFWWTSPGAPKKKLTSIFGVGSEDLHFSPKSDVTESSCGVTTLMRFDRRTSRCLEMGHVGVQTKQRLAAVRFFVRSSRGHTPSAFRGGHFSPKMHPSLKMRSWFIAIFVDCCE